MNQAINSAIQTMTVTEKAYRVQRSAYLQNPFPEYRERYSNLVKLEGLLKDNQEAIVEAINKDFGNRSRHESKIMELFACIDGIKDARKNLKKWMKPQKRHVSMWFWGAKNTVLPQPKGVIGVVTPWNYPLQLSISPAINALAAGNRCMIKMAANSQHLCRLMADLVAKVFDPATLTIIPEVSASEFTNIPYDHLVFTGSPDVGKRVMAKASEFLTPVTLELGGKSPTIIDTDFDIEVAAERILQGKLYNSGQTCTAPDYIFLPEGKADAFVRAAKRIVSQRYTNLLTQDLTSIIDEHAYERLCQTLVDAEEKGATVVSLLEGEQGNKAIRKLAPTLVVDVDDTMRIMQEEIFGPLLPIKTYKNLDDVLNYVNARERPLALYLFSHNKKIQNHVLKNTISGGVSLNDVILHAGQHDMPFGGIGNSGMGHYHGYEGFVEFSKLRPIFKQSKNPGSKMLAPPYGRTAEFMIKLMTR
jgi:coniferyl-aldehyde dehydrogenase